MEDVCAVLVDIDALYLFTVDVACDVVSLVDNKHLLASFVCLIGKDRTEKTCANYKIIVHIFYTP